MPYTTGVSSQEPCHLSEIIDVCPDYENTCVGYAVSKHRRCTIRVSVASRTSASRLLDQGTRLLQSGQGNIDDILEELAPLVLCKRQHQGQAAHVVREWSGKVDKFNQRRLTTAVSVSFSSSLSGRDRRQQSGDRVSIARASRESYTSSSSDIANARQSTDALQANTDLLMLRLSRLRAGLLPVSRVEVNGRDGSSRSLAESAITRNQPTINLSERHITQSITRNTSQQAGSSSENQPNTPTTSSRQTEAQPTHPQTPVQSQPTPGTSNNQTRRQATTRRRKVARKAIEGECQICFLSLRDNEEAATETLAQSSEDNIPAQNPSEDEAVVWCKKQCGYNFHKSCIDAWTGSCQGRCQAVTCPMCRSEWIRQ